LRQNRKHITDIAVGIASTAIVLFVLAVLFLAGYILLASLWEVAQDV
jgi:uncharacterized membrane protein